MTADATLELQPWSVGEPLKIMFTEQRTRILEIADEAKSVEAQILGQP